MGCCPPATASFNARHRMRVRYGGGRPVLVKGPVTGTEYHFSGVDRLQLVDPRDAVAIARSPLFRVDGLVEMAGAEETSSRRRGGSDA